MGAKFTLGVPTWNRADHLRRAIDSCLRQTEGDFEVIVSDNGSTDGTASVVAEFQDSRLRYIRHAVNRGALHNIKCLVDESRGDYFVLHQDDDLLHPEFLARCTQALDQHPDAKLFATAVLSGPEPEGMLGENLVLRDAPWIPVSHLPEQVACLNGVDTAIMQFFSLPFVPPGVAFETKCLRETGGFFDEFGWAGDNVTLARVGARGDVLYDPRPGAFLRFHAGNFSGTISSRKRMAYRRAANHIIVKDLDALNPHWPEQARAMLANLPTERVCKFLSTAWEGNYPPVLREVLADVLAGPSRVRRCAAHVRAALIQGRPKRVVMSRIAPVRIGS